jgi:hypothetical protein
MNKAFAMSVGITALPITAATRCQNDRRLSAPRLDVESVQEQGYPSEPDERGNA